MIKNEKIILKYIWIAFENWFSFWEKISNIAIKDQLSYSKNYTINLLWHYFSFYWHDTQWNFEMPLIELVTEKKFLKAIQKYISRNFPSQWVWNSVKNSSYNVFWTWIDYDELLKELTVKQALYISDGKLVDFIKILKLK